ncbi:MAG: methyltransferase domain-containing protein [Candidatus Levyibacteriota bacterium]|nr:MAG: methyltransferase domain-containing protein [Candidatus Levybacteria bacterium]
MRCISCGFEKLSTFLEVPNAPMRVQVISEKNLQRDKKNDLKILKCEKCTLIQLSDKNYVVNDYYDDYIMSRTYSPHARKYLKGLAKDFISFFDLKNKLVVDVGCGDGYFVYALLKAKSKSIGIEPSDVATRLAKDKGVKVIRDYVDDKFKLDQKADAFVTLEVFEHISDPKKLLTNIKKFLKVGGYGLVEVPSLVKTLRDNRYYDFFPDHVAYYSPTSLSYMLHLNGFDVFSVKHSPDENYLIAYFQYTNKSGLGNNIQKQFIDYRSQYKKFFRNIANNKIALWGAGAKGISSISFSNIPKDAIVFCVDSDPNKWGTYLPGSHIPVASPDALKKEDINVVVVTAMAYVDEIVSTLQKKYNFKKNQIAVITPEPMFLT